tara:strand:- start:183 stop:572 length:390 start_codon:yes stop_codon:yes gene_type:complete
MRLLIDTCVLLWLFADPKAIPSSVREKLIDSSSFLFLSHTSFFEIAIKYNKGKLELPEPPSILLPRLAAEHGVEPLPLTENVLFRIERLPRHHRDPFDRLIVAHAMEEGLTIVSADKKLRPYDVPILWD